MPPDDTSTPTSSGSGFFPKPDFATTTTPESTPDASSPVDASAETAPNAQPNDDSTDTGGADDTSTVAEIAAIAAELGITPGQLKGRLEASRKWEQRAKKADEDAEAARQAAMSDQERAVEDAKKAGKAEAVSELGQRIAAAELRAALTGLVPEPALIVEDVNLAKFVTDNGEVDTDAVAAFRAKYVGQKPSFQGSADGGPQGDSTQEPTLDEQIAAAQKAGNTRLVMQLQNRKLTALATS